MAFVKIAAEDLDAGITAAQAAEAAGAGTPGETELTALAAFYTAMREAGFFPLSMMVSLARDRNAPDARFHA
jgi:hypothetical protein